MNEELFRELHEEEYRRQAVDDREALERLDFMAAHDCFDCKYRSERGECVNLTSPYFGEEVSYNDICEEIETDEED